jgi:putative SOS response-associated peptidase YedK
MLAILPNDRFARWLSDEADPRELLVPFPADQLAVSPQRSRRCGQFGLAQGFLCLVDDFDASI